MRTIVFFLQNYLATKSPKLPEKCPKYGIISGPYFPVFSPNTKIRTSNNSVFGHFSRRVKDVRMGFKHACGHAIMLLTILIFSIGNLVLSNF